MKRRHDKAIPASCQPGDEDILATIDYLDNADMPTKGRLLWVDDEEGGHIIGDKD